MVSAEQRHRHHPLPAHVQVSNFEYLMFLNREAGRSFNDLTQYPVFPWVIQDYESPSLNMTDPAVFRQGPK